LTMPSAKRLARRSVALVTRQGLPRGQAAAVIMHLCDDVANRLYQASIDPDLTWLVQLRAEAHHIWAREQRSPELMPCPSLVDHQAHDWWPDPSQRYTCPGIGASRPPSA
jgi:hypothetical protein